MTYQPSVVALLGAVTCSVFGCAAAPARPSPDSGAVSACELSPGSAGYDGSHRPPQGYGARVTVTPEEAGTWLVEYAFAEPESALIFWRSLGDYRRETWVSLSDGVRIAREGSFDTIVLDSPAVSARFRVTPYEPIILGDYSPVVTISDGGQAMFIGQFHVDRVASAEAAAALTSPADWIGEMRPFTLVMNTDAKLVALGERIDGPACFDSQDPVTYVYYGSSDVVEGESYIGVVDPGLPDWIENRFDQDLRSLYAKLERGFGSPLPQRANLLFAYGGSDSEGISLKGSVLPGALLALEVEGAQLDTSSTNVQAALLYYFAHESAHLFQARERTVRTADSWIHEGHATAIGRRLSPGDGRWKEQDDELCREALQSGGSLVAALGTHPYECGALTWSLAERLAPHGDVYSLWDALGDEAEDATADTERFLSVLLTAGAGGPAFDELSRALRGEEDVEAATLLGLVPIQD